MYSTITISFIPFLLLGGNDHSNTGACCRFHWVDTWGFIWMTQICGIEYLVAPYWPLTASIARFLAISLIATVRDFRAQLLCPPKVSLWKERPNSLQGAPGTQPWWPKWAQRIMDKLPLPPLIILGRNHGTALTMVIKVVVQHMTTSVDDIITMIAKPKQT